MSPLDRYQRDLARPGFVADPAQRRALSHIQTLYQQVVSSPPTGGRLSRLWKRRSPMPQGHGLYLWGGVGRGKTYLMDLLYESLPPGVAQRTHFHRFMREAHRELTARRGTKDPLRSIGHDWGQRTRLLCLDEFFVTDITDAMILAGLLEALFAAGTTLMATSNLAPHQLYENGLQRERFLPAIDLIEQHTHVVELDGGVDHRLRVLQQAELYHCPLDEAATRQLTQSFAALSTGASTTNTKVEVEGRDIAARALSDGCAWFEFGALCDGPRSSADYLELARSFHTLLVSGLPQFRADLDEQARRFINLVDVLYDHNVKLVVSAAVPITGLYTSGRLGFEFQRTQSRLLEMQSAQYLKKAHRP